MNFPEVLRAAASSLLGSRGRSVLTVLSITIGAFAIVLMSSLADSGLRTLERGIEELGGARILFVAQKKPERGEAKQSAYEPGLKLTDRDNVFRDVPHVASVSMFSRMRRADVLSDSGAKASTDLLAVDGGFFAAFNMKVARGRALTDDDSRSHASVCVVGHKVEAKVGEVLGRSITVGPMRCRVVGIFADNDRFGVRFGFDWTDLVVVPSESLAAIDPNVRYRAAMIIKTDDVGSNEAVKRLINARMMARHPGVDDFTLYDFSGIMEQSARIFTIMKLLVAMLASIALVIGGVGVMNMMLVAVSERVKEIGLRKALGARPRDIGGQFLSEALLLGAVGGGVGVLLGLGVAAGAAVVIHKFIASWQTSMAPGSALVAFLVCIAIGGVFGWLPARRASRLDPVLAMQR